MAGYKDKVRATYAHINIFASKLTDFLYELSFLSFINLGSQHLTSFKKYMLLLFRNNLATDLADWYNRKINKTYLFREVNLEVSSLTND